MLLLAIAYAVGAVLHLLDVLDLRLKFTAMNTLWKSWIIYLLVFDTLAAIGLCRKKIWGDILFLFIASSQLIAYTKFNAIFGNQDFLITFHVVCIILYTILKTLDFWRHKWPAYSAK